MASQPQLAKVAVGSEQLPVQCVASDPLLVAGSDDDDEHLAACHFPLSSAELATVMGTGSKSDETTVDQVNNQAMEP